MSEISNVTMQIHACGECGAARVWGERVPDTLENIERTPVLICAGNCPGATRHTFIQNKLVRVTEYELSLRGHKSYVFEFGQGAGV